jgi:hypothetical protein
MPLIAPAYATAESVWQSCVNIGLRVVRVQQASEADVRAWQQTLDEYFDAEGRYQPEAAPQHVEQHTSPWLVFVRKALAPGGTDLRTPGDAHG